MFNVSTPMLVLRSREGDFLSARGRIFFLVWEPHLHFHLDNAKVRNFRHTMKYQLLMNC
jgi:hypothetical protein